MGNGIELPARQFEQPGSSTTPLWMAEATGTTDRVPAV
jgi:hypothetical protein